MAFIFFLKNYLRETQTVTQLIDLLGNSAKILPGLLKELDMAIDLFNKSQQFGKELINADKLKKLIGDKNLPDANSVWNDLFADDTKKNNRLFQEFILEFSRFKFIEEIDSPQQLLECLIVAIYRTYMLVKYPALKGKNTQVASTLEEMFAIMALSGKEKHLFQATKHWIMDWKKEGFSRELVEKIVKL